MGTRTVEIISGGTVVHEHGAIRGDVIVREGRIVGLVEDSTGLAGERLDVSGKWVFPGGVDMHTHLREPSRIEREDFAHGTASAAAGGICTVIDMPQADPLVADVASFRQKRDAAARGSVVDFGLHAAAIGQSIERMAELKAEGVMAFKAFLCASSPGYPRLNDAALLHTLRAVRELDAMLIVHAENDDLLQDGLARMAA